MNILKINQSALGMEQARPEKKKEKKIMWYQIPGIRVWYERSCSVWLDKGGAPHTNGRVSVRGEYWCSPYRAWLKVHLLILPLLRCNMFLSAAI